MLYRSIPDIASRVSVASSAWKDAARSVVAAEAHARWAGVALYHERICFHDSNVLQMVEAMAARTARENDGDDLSAELSRLQLANAPLRQSELLAALEMRVYCAAANAECTPAAMLVGLGCDLTCA